MTSVIKYTFWFASLGVLVAVLLWLTLYPSIDQSVEKPEPTPPATAKKKDEKEPAPEQKDQQRVDLKKVITPSETAMREAQKGRFLVYTSISEDTSKKRLYSHMVNRGGIMVIQDNQQHAYIMEEGGTKKPIEKASIDLSDYALHRPRMIPHSDINELPYNIQPEADEHVLLIMPNRFEAEVITYIEEQLPQPLTNYSESHVEFSLGRSGNLNYKLTDGK